MINLGQRSTCSQKGFNYIRQSADNLVRHCFGKANTRAFPFILLLILPKRLDDCGLVCCCFQKMNFLLSVRLGSDMGSHDAFLRAKFDMTSVAVKRA